MDDIFIALGLALIGAALGSFAGATMWRLRAKQLVEDKKAGEKVNSKEYKRLLPLTKQGIWRGRSVDLDTGKQLKWYDLIPVFSWLALRGKSRYSGKPIGYFELLIELGLAAFFVLSFWLWPHPLGSGLEIARLAVWLLAGVILALQFATDYKWSVLWTIPSYLIIALGAASSVLAVMAAPDAVAAAWSAVGSVAVLGGLYFALYVVSRERWVGFGDVILGIGLGLLLADWALALVALFMANLIGSIVVLIGFASGRVKRGQQVPFGPFFIAGAVLAQLVGHEVIIWYSSTLLG